MADGVVGLDKVKNKAKVLIAAAASRGRALIGRGGYKYLTAYFKVIRYFKVTRVIQGSGVR